MRRLPIFILMDTSGRMQGERINRVNKTIEEMVVHFRHDPFAIETVFISMATFNMNFQVINEFTELGMFELRRVTEEPSTPAMLGKALSCLTDWLKKRTHQATVGQKGDLRGCIYLFWGGGLADPHDFSEAVIELSKVKMNVIVVPFASIKHRLPPSWRCLQPDETGSLTKIPFEYLEDGPAPCSEPVQNLPELPKEIILLL